MSKIPMRSSIWLALCIFLTEFNLLIDVSTPLRIADGILYAGVILLAARFLSRPYIFFFAIICTVLTLLGFFFSPSDVELWRAFTNRLAGIFSIWVTAILSWQLQQAIADLLQHRQHLEERVTTLTA